MMGTAKATSGKATPGMEGAFNAGVGTVDDKGRLSLSKPARNALGIEPGSSVAYMVLNGMLLVVPEDKHLEHLMAEGMRALAEAGLTVQDLLDELPAARQRVYEETYSPEFRAELEREWRALHGSEEEGDE